MPLTTEKNHAFSPDSFGSLFGLGWVFGQQPGPAARHAPATDQEEWVDPNLSGAVSALQCEKPTNWRLGRTQRRSRQGDRYSPVGQNREHRQLVFDAHSVASYAQVRSLGRGTLRPSRPS